MDPKTNENSGGFVRDSQSHTEYPPTESITNKSESRIDTGLSDINEETKSLEHYHTANPFVGEVKESFTDGAETLYGAKLDVEEREGIDVTKKSAGKISNIDSVEPRLKVYNHEAISEKSEIKTVEGVLVNPTTLDRSTQSGDRNKSQDTHTSTSHRIKRFKFFNRQVSICLQNENGPCPLLALANVLILRGAIHIHPDRSEISSDLLIELIAGHLLETNPPLAEDDAYSKDQQKTLADIIDILPTLQFGLDVNVQFSGVKNFEYDSRIAVFDMLDISLYHGWLVDPNDEITYSVLYNKSYNQLVDKIIEGQQLEASIKNNKTQEASLDESEPGKKGQVLREASIAQQFLTDTASQLTYLGLMELYSIVKERETCVFFRNNHFSTMFKFEGQLYLLLTDQGYEKQDAVAWERLNEIDGNTDICSPTFSEPNEYIAQTLNNSPDTADFIPPSLSQDNAHVDQDRLLAIQLQEQELHQRENELASNQPQSPARPPESSLNLERIDVEAQKKEMEAIQRRRNGNSELSSNSTSSPNESKNSGCIIN